MSLKDEKVKEISLAYNIPVSAATLCVDDMGVVNQEKLAVATAVMGGVKDGLTAKTRAEVEVFKADLKACQEAVKDPNANKMLLCQRMISLKQAIFERGGHP
jgi:hypothetical protein